NRDRERNPRQLPRIECDRPTAQRLADEPAVDVEGCDEDLAHGPRRLELAECVDADGGLAPARPADAEEPEVEAVPQIRHGPNPGVRPEGIASRRVVEQAGREQALDPCAE